MKRALLIVLAIISTSSGYAHGCPPYPDAHARRQSARNGAMGGALGAIAGQVIGHSTRATVGGAAAGIIAGIIFGPQDRRPVDHFYTSPDAPVCVPPACQYPGYAGCAPDARAAMIIAAQADAAAAQARHREMQSHAYYFAPSQVEDARVRAEVATQTLNGLLAR